MSSLKQNGAFIFQQYNIPKGLDKKKDIYEKKPEFCFKFGDYYMIIFLIFQ